VTIEAVRVLLVEDDTELAGLLAGLFAEEGYQVDTARDGQRALHLGLTRSYDVLVLDRGLPGIEGLDVLGRLRRAGMTQPVLVLSARANPADRVTGLDAGAEDYLAKPFDVEELLARLRALRRRHLDAAEALPLGGRHWLELATRQVVIRGDDTPSHANHPGSAATRVQLSARECDLLGALATRPTRVFARNELLTRVFADAENPVVVDTYVHYLRRKLGPRIVRTIRGRGYQLGTPEPADGSTHR
jgi:two-component system response regulator QseB